jgi:hypothetical protein
LTQSDANKRGNGLRPPKSLREKRESSFSTGYADSARAFEEAALTTDAPWRLMPVLSLPATNVPAEDAVTAWRGTRRHAFEIA